MMRATICLSILAVVLAASAPAAAQPADLAAAFGAREGVQQMVLSPDGKKIAIVAPAAGVATAVLVVDTASGTVSKSILTVSGKPERIAGCSWVANTRVACTVWGLRKIAGNIEGFSTVIAMDDTGANQRVISQKRRASALYVDRRGGGIIDLLPDEDGSVLMARSYVPESTTGTLVSSNLQGLGVDRVDTRTGIARRLVTPKPTAAEYITDGRGNVRIMGLSRTTDTGYAKGAISYSYRRKGSEDWQPLGVFDYARRTGFNPVAIDSDKDIVYAFEAVDGRQALVSYALDGSMRRELINKQPQVDVDSLVQIGRRARVVGVGYTTDYTRIEYFDPAIKALQDSLVKALGGTRQVGIVDTSIDEQKAIVWAGSDTDPGQYYLLDRSTRKLGQVTPERPELAGVKLGTVKPVSYPAADGTIIPAYLTLPPGSSGKNLPAIVLPHGGPEARDYWGFDWLSQYFVARGFAVIQPQFRGSAGFGEVWFKKNGFQSWRTSIGDVADAGRWLNKQGIADPSKLVIFGWSYGGYAALQATVLAPGLFKAAVAVAPVTDLASLKASAVESYGYYIERDFIGSGPHITEGSPAQNVAQIGVPVLLFHGTLDTNVPFAQSRMMDERLRAAGKSSELVTFEGLDHQLVDGAARATMLRRAGDFLLAAGK